MLYNFNQFLNSLPPTEEIVVRDMCDNVLVRANKGYIMSCSSMFRRLKNVDVLTVYLDEVLTKEINVILDC